MNLIDFLFSWSLLVGLLACILHLFLCFPLPFFTKTLRKEKVMCWFAFTASRFLLAQSKVNRDLAYLTWETCLSRLILYRGHYWRCWYFELILIINPPWSYWSGFLNVSAWNELTIKLPVFCINYQLLHIILSIFYVVWKFQYYSITPKKVIKYRFLLYSKSEEVRWEIN